ncbi:carbohydrate ABC transporter permease [Anaerocolumna sp. MB42-C2]|uniref:carbohydrate ABC transporter permease n=1 Tax=Anaerocolumna sp. MB42-C2 TaxID=3070997 RepID=UPI0027E201CA|nr:sugar ABC transporter permease [Anaerocolumna sp. MB42-C2]WMJ89863.1 sugar ABC transporter permease [Anaerocolumna sp. MB42-C2]
MKAAAVKKKKPSKLFNDAKWAWIMLLPNILGFCMFMLIPVVATFLLSFTKYDMLTKPKFIGLKNYIDMIHDPIVWQVTGNTILYTVMTVPVGMCLSLLLAVALDQKIGLKRFYRAAFFLPSITSMVVISIVWQWIYNPEFGLLNFGLSFLGLPTGKWLTSASTSLVSIAIVGIWKRLGYDMIIFLSGLQGISTTYYEAAKLDGASKLQQFRYITVPMLKPTTFFVFIMAIINSFQVFDQVMLMTTGGPGRSSSVLVHYLYQNAFQYFKLGYACAIAYLLFAIVMIITAINLKMEKSMREIY